MLLLVSWLWIICTISTKNIVFVNSSEEGQIRLFGSTSGNQGNVLVFHKGIWGSICDDMWSIENAHVVCRILGYSSAVNSTQNSFYGISNHRIWLDNVKCIGNESNIIHCKRNEWGDNDCSPSELAGVHCLENPLNIQPLLKKKKNKLKNEIILTKNSSLEIFERLKSKISCFEIVNDLACNSTNINTSTNNDTYDSQDICTQRTSILKEINFLVSTTDHVPKIIQLMINLNDLTNNFNNSNVKCEINDLKAISTETIKYSNQTDFSNISNVTLINGGTNYQGTILINYNGKRGFLCGDTFTYNVAKVICKSMKLGYVSAFLQYGFFGGDENNILIDGLICTGNEEHLGKCIIDKQAKCPRRKNGVAGIQCAERLPDLLVDLNLLRRDFYIEDKTLSQLQCAMEEFCVQPSAYKEILEPDGYFKRRRLVRFTTAIINNGTAPFRPNVPKHMWEWHMCHMHFHSMERFAIYQIIDSITKKELLFGHKASFCLEDNVCDGVVKPQFACANFGDQGITPKCVDVYLHNIDCQWIDITGLKAGNYKFIVMLNTDYKVMELNYDNNAIECDWWYDGIATQRLGKCEYKNPN